MAVVLSNNIKFIIMLVCGMSSINFLVTNGIIVIISKSTSKKSIQIIAATTSLSILFFTCNLMLKGAGIDSNVQNTFLLTILIVILNSSKKSFFYLAIPMVVLYALYAPIGLLFGTPSYQSLASIVATNLLESKEFFQNIPSENYLLAALIIPGIFLFRFITNKFDIKLYRNKTALCFFVIFSMLNQSPAEFFKNIINSGIKVKDELEKINKMKVDDEWGKSTLNSESKYDNYILVIGESARKDYHHAYGYPIENTPFLSKSKGVLVNGLTSGGANTISSLRLMLTKADKVNWEPDYSLNFIDLVKSAGVKTYWISNQGVIGEHDTPIAALANRSNSKIFLKYGAYDSVNTSDFDLIPHLDEIMQQNPKEKKLIVMHLYGSHPFVCARITDYHKIIKIKDPIYREIACYATSINKTDDLLQTIYNKMKENYAKTGASFSMLYFADHGLVRSENGDKIHIVHGYSQETYQVPLFQVASDSEDKKICHSFKSALNFTEGLANWMGINNDKASFEYNLFDCKDDKNDYGLSETLKQYRLDNPFDLTDK
ncbi:phosphoethanolamine transferase [Xenorhabdus miraniensis]|uniref:Sulfatase N-terminal domain-containing protein n=1 Tax=Xenorhabdus miraniensis TaxID=351674 RepID=A0A2D0JLN2_9GAMM|nr:phosphoethanolamine transferase [Xenorhabdus miraniensis]PHM47218.1 hypothetical protein Xmir_03431 [Xenorhabdus miraniensis]